MIEEKIRIPDRVARESAPAPLTLDDRTLRFVAYRQAERVRNFLFHLAGFVVGMLLLGGIWALTEYQNAGGWPERLNDDGGPGTWNPWILWVLIAWGAIVAVHGLVTYFRRPISERELDRQLDRLERAG